MDEDFLKDLFADIGPITVKRMFGGQGIYGRHGIFAVVVYGELYVKGDAESSGRYEDAGMARWTYEAPKTGKRSSMPYWRVPASALDDPEAMRPFAKLADETARRARANK